MEDFIKRLKQRKLVQWAVAYIAFAFALIQVADVVSDSYGWSHGVMHLLFGLLVLGFVVALLLAWYHGEQGRQRASSTELLLIGLVLAVGGGMLWRFAPANPTQTDGANTETPANHAASATAPASGGTAQGSSSAAIPAKSIAVLPFVNMSGDPKNDYFSDGITEEILDALAQVPKLKVAARTSAFAFKGKAEDLSKVGDVLDVATVLEGSVQKSGDEVRITAQLIDTRTDYHLWSEKYDRKLTSIFEVEDEISKAIADKLQVQLAESVAQSLVPQQTIDPHAHDFYLRGLSLLAARGPGLRDAVAAFAGAIDIAPQYAQAWGALAQAQALSPAYGLGSAKEVYPRALASAQHALALNPDTASALVAQGIVYTNQWQWAKADAVFARALALAPGDAETASQYGQFLAATGKFGPALAEIEHAQKLDPLAPINGVARARTLYLSHRNDEAWVEIQRSAADFPDLARVQGTASFLAMVTHRWSDAERHVRNFGTLSGFSVGEMAASIDLIHGMADPALHATTALRLKTAPKGRKRTPRRWIYARWLCMLDDCKAALPVLEQIAAQGENTDPDNIWIPAFDPIRGDPRFKAVLKKMSLPYSPAKDEAK